MNRIILLSALILGSLATPNDNLVDKTIELGTYNADFSIGRLNNIFINMVVTETQIYHLKDDSYYTLTKSDKSTLTVILRLYSPLEKTHKLAFESTYDWNDIANSLVAHICENKDIKVHPPKLMPQCEEAILVGSRLIGLEIEGSIDLEDFDSENVEKCLQSKLDPKTFEDSYLRCLITIIGDKSYAKKALKHKIQSFEAKGYNCDSKGNCYYHENPQILAQILDHHKDPSRMVYVPGDPRPRTCDVASEQGAMPHVGDPSMGFASSHIYSCGWRVTAIYCKQDKHKLQFGFEYTNEEGKVNKFFTSRFKLEDPNVTRRIVNASQGEHISGMTLLNDKYISCVRELHFRFNNSSDDFKCKLGPEYSREGEEFDQFDIPVDGEIAGVNFADTAAGVKVPLIYLRK